MTSILMVCLGNICRSPVAEGILTHKLKETNINAKVDSAGTSNYHIDGSPDPRSMANAKKNGIDISRLRGRQFTVEDFDNFDLIYAMDSMNYQNIIALARNENDKEKVDLILNLLSPNSNSSVPDPYYGEGDGFENVFQLLNQACEHIIQRLKSNTAI